MPYHLTIPVRMPDGKSHLPSESLELVRTINNLGKSLTLVKFEDGSTGFLAEHEFVKDENEKASDGG